MQAISKAIKRYWWGSFLLVLPILVLIMAGIVWQSYQRIRPVVQMGNAVVEALFHNDFRRIGDLARCDVCKTRIQRKWESIVDRLGKLHSWQFQRVVKVVEFGSSRPTHHAIGLGCFEVEYRMHFATGYEATVVVEVIDSEDGYRLQALRVVKYIGL